MSIDYKLTSIYEKNLLVDGKDSDHNEPNMQN